MCEYVNIALRRFLHNHGNIATEGSPKPGLCPTLILNNLKGSLQYHRQHCTPLNSLEHCICRTTMTNVRPDRGLNLVHPGYKPHRLYVYVCVLPAGHICTQKAPR